MATPLQWPQMDPEQQSLLLAALTSNRPKPGSADVGIDPSVFDASLQSDFDLGSFDDGAFQDFPDHDAANSDETLAGNVLEDSPTRDGEGREKRKSFSEDDDEAEGDERVERAQRDAVGQQRQELGHERSCSTWEVAAAAGSMSSPDPR